MSPAGNQFGAIVTAAVVGFGGACPASADEWPTRPVTMVVPTAAGGGTDVFGRILVPRLSELLGQQVIVENVGVSPIAASRVAKAPPDGYRFALGTAATHAYSPSLYKNPLYDAVKDFEPVILIAEQPLLLVTRNDYPAGNLAEFTAYAKANEIKFGSGAGIGSANHLVCALLNSALGISPIHVPYRDQGRSTQDMIAGRIDYQCPLPTTMIPLIETHQVKGIAFLGKERLASLPGLATAQEQGLAGFVGATWDAFFFPRGTPPAIVAKLHDATVAAMESPEVLQRLAVIGASIVAPERRSPEYLGKFVRNEIEKWSAPIKASGASLD
jgi:tripartite-type tricarboxylate transporter receptor subunit TctC